jgi:hypothetical protein
MQKTKTSVIFLLVFLSLAGCQMSGVRNIASDKDTDGIPALAEPQVHPGSDMFIKKGVVHLHDGTANKWKAGKLKLKKYKISTPEGFNAFGAHVDSLLKNDTDKSLPKAAKRSLREIQAILVTLSQMKAASASPEQLNGVLAHLYELCGSFNYNFQLPVKEQMWVLAVPVEVIGRMAHTTMSKKAKPANNVAPAADSSLQNPVNSSFWVQPIDLEKRNLYYGFNRKALPEFKSVCKYNAPKTSYGTHGGFEIKCDGQKIKVKFGNETKTEPFNSRLLWALGYNATPVDYSKGIQVEYDRKVLTEYNERKNLTTDLRSALGFSYHKLHIQKILDPFTDGIAYGRLVDGRTLSSEELRQMLLKPDFIARFQAAPVKITDADINAEAEKQIAVLILKEGSIELENDSEQSLGPWSWNDFDHPERRELRGFSVFASFLNLFDVRTDNNRLRVAIDEDGQKKLKHYVSDLGSGFGNASNLLKFSNGQINAYPWEFVKERPTTVYVGPRREIRQQTPYSPVDYQPLEHNEAFVRAQPDDVRWAARLLGRISDQQLIDALIASGFNASETKLLLEKMTSRRQNLMRVFNLVQEHPQIMSRKVDRLFNYDPKAGDVPQALGSRERKRAVVSGSIQKGQYIP